MQPSISLARARIDEPESNVWPTTGKADAIKNTGRISEEGGEGERKDGNSSKERQSRLIEQLQARP